MTTATITAPAQRKQELLGETVVVIGDSAGIGLETARRARAEGADAILTAFDATDTDRLEQFFDELPGPIDHVIVAAAGSDYEPLAEMSFARARRFFDEHLMLPLHIARSAAGKIRPEGTLLFVGGTGARRPAAGVALGSAVTVGMRAIVASLAVELAPVRVNLIAAGFVDTPWSASLRDTLPTGRVVGSDDLAATAVHLVAHPALTGATYDVDRGRQLLPRGV